MIKLFPVPLQGVGTEDVESLSSYLIRLSNAHGRSLKQFLLFLDMWAFVHIRELSRPSHSHIQMTAVSLSKANDTTERLVGILQKASNATGLRSATLQCLSNSYKRMMFSISGKLRWCPRCMAEWKRDGEIAYFKLVWLFTGAQYCNRHAVSLISRCRECGKEQSGYSFRKRLDECGNCNASLAVPIRKADVVPIKKRNAGDIFQLVEQIALNPDLQFVGNGVPSIISVLDRRAEKSEEAREVFNSLFPVYWKQIGKHPRDLTFEETRVFAMISGITLFDALQGNCIGQTRAISYSWSEGTKNQWTTEVRKRRNFEATKIALAKHLSKTKGTHPSLKSVAESIDVSVGYLCYRFKSQAKKITHECQTNKQRVAESERLRARRAAMGYFSNAKIDDRLKSKKAALRALRLSTKLSKGLLMRQISEVYEIHRLKQS